MVLLLAVRLNACAQPVAVSGQVSALSRDYYRACVLTSSVLLFSPVDVGQSVVVLRQESPEGKRCSSSATRTLRRKVDFLHRTRSHRPHSRSKQDTILSSSAPSLVPSGPLPPAGEQAGLNPKPEIMVPVVSTARELKLIVPRIQEALREELADQGQQVGRRS